ncbi:MAG: PQQ-binding-like beta-propeller repeat protein [Candidatus Spyradocola sp.]|jgi:outer membrane protein assembly factor BamB
METFPMETCVFCDLPWKNNRVCYSGALAPAPEVRALHLGSTRVTLSEAGEILGVGPDGEVRFRFATGIRPADGTLAFDALHRLLYFAADRRLVAVSLEDGRTAFTCAATGLAGSPTLFEFQDKDGTARLAAGFGDGAGAYIACDRVTGERLWQAQTLGTVVDVAAHYAGYLYMVLRGAPCQVLCLEARSGDLVWWNRGRKEGVLGQVLGEAYCVQSADGTVQRFLLEDGERL